MHQIKSFFVLFILGFTVTIRAQVSTGAFVFAYTNLETFVDLCLKDVACGLTQDQQVILTRISSVLPVEKRNLKQLVLASEKEQPGLFILDGELKVAKTFDDIGSTIYLNRDMIEHSVFQVVDAVAILVHELGHHHKIKDESYLDLLGLRVAFYYQQKFLQVAQNGQVPGLMVSAFNYWIKVSLNSVFRSRDHFDLVLSDGKSMEVLSAPFRGFNCSAYVPKDTRCDSPPVMAASNVQNLSWSAPGTLVGQVTYICRCLDNSLSTLYSVRKNFDLNVKFKNNFYQPNSAVIRIAP